MVKKEEFRPDYEIEKVMTCVTDTAISFVVGQSDLRM